MCGGEPVTRIRTIKEESFHFNGHFANHDRFEKALREGDLPVSISEDRLEANPMQSTARGALVAALSEI